MCRDLVGWLLGTRNHSSAVSIVRDPVVNSDNASATTLCRPEVGASNDVILRNSLKVFFKVRKNEIEIGNCLSVCILERGSAFARPISHVKS